MFCFVLLPCGLSSEANFFSPLLDYKLTFVHAILFNSKSLIVVITLNLRHAVLQHESFNDPKHLWDLSAWPTYLIPTTINIFGWLSHAFLTSLSFNLAPTRSQEPSFDLLLWLFRQCLQLLNFKQTKSKMHEVQAWHKLQLILDVMSEQIH